MAAVTYTNTKGVTFTLCRVERANGKTVLAFCKEPKGEPVESLPEGHEISESVNGVVSVRKCRPSALAPEEIEYLARLVRANGHGLWVVRTDGECSVL